MVRVLFLSFCILAENIYDPNNQTNYESSNTKYKGIQSKMIGKLIMYSLIFFLLGMNNYE